jgi:hypothetical protein
MARNGKWNKKSKFGKFACLRFYYENPGNNKDSFANRTGRGYETIEFHIETGNLIEQYFDGEYSLELTIQGISLYNALKGEL